jgi:hypothetical protein
MLFTRDLADTILINPIQQEAVDELKIVSGYATPTMASWHIKTISTKNLPSIRISLIIGMCVYDGLSVSAHQGFQNLVVDENFQCQYIYQGRPDHSKIYIWLRESTPILAFTGSANYSQSAFRNFRNEVLVSCDPFEALDYYNRSEENSIYCTHSEVEEFIQLKKDHPLLEAEENPVLAFRGAGIKHVTLPLLKKNGEIGNRSGLNWGQRERREPNQAYIPLPVNIARSDFFPLEGQHFSVITDDNKQLILRVEQQNDKAITTPLNNSLLGEYFRNRLGKSNGVFLTKSDLLTYGRTDVTFYRIDEEHYFLDFSV